MGSNANLFAGAGSLIQGGTKFLGAEAQAGALSAKGNYDAAVATGNANIATLQGKFATENGDIEAVNARTQAGVMQGKQRAAFGAQGIDVNSGSASATQANTAGMGALDAMTIKNNAWKQAWGYQTQATNYTAQSAFDKLSGETAAGSTLLTGGLQFLQGGMKAGGQFFGPGKAYNQQSYSDQADYSGGSGYSGGFGGQPSSMVGE